MKGWSILGAMKYIFKGKDINLRAKALIYIGGPINALMWGADHGTYQSIISRSSVPFTTQPWDGY
jgi:hypothetical protein